MSTNAAASTSSLYPRLTFRDGLRFLLFLAIPIYARFCIPPSISSIFRHMYIIGTTGISIAHFSGAWIVPDIEGWRDIVIQWAFNATTLIFLLPESYGSDVRALSAEYKRAYPLFRTCVGVFSGFIVWCSFGRRGYSWYDVLVVGSILAAFVEHIYLVRLNYICLCKFGKTVRENSWSYKDMFKKPWPNTNAYGRELTIEEVLQWHSTGSIRPRARKD